MKICNERIIWKKTLFVFSFIFHGAVTGIIAIILLHFQILNSFKLINNNFEQKF